MFNFFKNRKNASLNEFETENSVEEFIEVSADLMDAAFDRSAGRDCTVCGFHGSHHTDNHNEFAQAAIDRTQGEV